MTDLKKLEEAAQLFIDFANALEAKERRSFAELVRVMAWEMFDAIKFNKDILD